MNKRGSDRRALFLGFMLFLGAIAGVALVKGAVNFMQDTTYWKIFYARDLGLLMDAGLTGRGEIDINYDFDFAKKPLSLYLKEQSVEIYNYDPEVENPPVTSFRFASNPNIKIKPTEIFAPRLNILIGDEVSITEKPSKKEICNKVNTSATKDTSIYVSSGDKIIDNLIKSRLEKEGLRIIEKAEKAELALYFMKREHKDMKFHYLYESRKNYKLRCTIKNQLISDGFTLFFNEIKLIGEKSPFRESVKNTNQAMIIEVGDLEVNMANSIIKGVIAYYE